MRILVCITHVPDTTAKISFKNNQTEFDKTDVPFVLGPYDDFAISKAVDMKSVQGVHVTVLNVGEAETEPTLRRALALGADEAIRVNVHPADSWFTAVQIAEVIKNGQYDLILMGRESYDYNGGVVHGMVGEITGIPSFTPVMKLEINGDQVLLTKEIEGGYETLETKLPLIAGCQEPIAEWKIPNMRGIMTARSKPLKVLDPVQAECCLRTLQFEQPDGTKQVKWFTREQIHELVTLLVNDSKVI